MGSPDVCFRDDPQVILTGRGQMFMTQQRADMPNRAAVRE